MAKKEKRGRKTVVTEEVLGKLEEAFKIGATDEEACAYAKIAPRVLYLYQERNPEYIQEKEALKELPAIKARNNVVASVNKGNVIDSKWYLERKKKDEFSTREEKKIEGEMKTTPTTITINQPPPKPKSIMQMHKVVSSNIKQIGYNPVSMKCRVRFSNDVAYDYHAIPEDVFIAFLKAKSKGKFLGSKIKGKFIHTKILDKPIKKKPVGDKMSQPKK